MQTRQLWLPLSHPLLTAKNIQLWVCQVLTEHPLISGNKWLKLKYHIVQLQQQQKQGLFTFGGAFSNHIAAVSAACHQFKLKNIVYLRADTLDRNNPTIQNCLQHGTEFILLSRSEYRQRHEFHFLQRLQHNHPHLIAVPEGGSSVAGVKGVAGLDLAATPAGSADLIVCATASGGTLAGIINNTNKKVLGIAVVKDVSLHEKVQQFLQPSDNRQWQLDFRYTGKGYARFSDEILNFCLEIKERENLTIEPVYTGKALFGLFNMIQNGEIANGSNISFFHTGGLQGLAGLHYRKLITPQQLSLLSA